MRKQMNDRTYKKMHVLNGLPQVTQLVRGNPKTRTPELWFS